MKNESGKRNLALCLGLVSIIYAVAGQAVHAHTPVGFRLVSDALVVVPVLINEEGPFDFLLDTGTSTTIITPGLARQLNLQASGNVSLITLAGTEVVPQTVLDSLALGAKSIKRLEVLFDDLRGVRAVDAKIRGVLGQNFLSRFNYLLSYRERCIEFEEDGDLESRLTGTRLAVEQREGKLIVSSQATTPWQETLRLALDSGASHLVLFAAARNRLGFRMEPPGTGFLAATNAAGNHVKLRRLQSLQIGSERLTNLPVALIEDHAPIERYEDGLLPTRLFRAIFFQNDKHQVILNPHAA